MEKIFLAHPFFQQLLRDNPFAKTWRSVPPTTVVNVPLSVNGYHGDAVIAPKQSLSTVSRRLAGLPETSLGRRRSDRTVQVKMLIGEEKAELSQICRIMEESPDIVDVYYDDEEDKPYEFVLGEDFLIACSVTINVSRRLITSPIFGSAPSPVKHGPLKKFSKDYKKTNYGIDADPRVIILLDIDCFEVQVHQRECEIDRPRVVVNGTRIVAVSYEAKALGINRMDTPYMRDALRICPELIIIPIPTRGDGQRPDNSVALEATSTIKACIKKFLTKYGEENSVFEFSSGDEFFIDVTSIVNDSKNLTYYWCKENLDKKEVLWNNNTYFYDEHVFQKPDTNHVKITMQRLSQKEGVLDWTFARSQSKRLLYGSVIATELIRTLERETGFISSAGISSKKIVSKISSSLHKPAGITVVTPTGFDTFCKVTKLEDISGLGGKLGQRIKEFFGISTVWDVRQLGLEALSQVPVEDDRNPDGTGIVGSILGLELLNKAHGIHEDIVKPLDSYKKCGVTRQLYGRSYVLREISDKLHDLCYEMLEKLRLTGDKRKPVKIRCWIKLSGHCRNISSCLGSQEGLTFQNGSKLYANIVEVANPPCDRWEDQMEVDEISIKAEFE